jgi:hypothetical protein
MITRTITLALAAGFALSAAVAAQDMTPEDSDALNATIAAGFDAQMTALEAMDCPDDDMACLSEELIERYRLDQWARGQFFEGELCGAFAETHRQDCDMRVMGSAVFRIDLPNHARLKEIMAMHGWPRPPLFDNEAQRGAWYIAQHGQVIDENGATQWDVDFARSIMPEVRAAVEREELSPWDYGRMYDRIALHSGQPQRYATQMMCEEGRAVFRNVEDEARVDEFRAEIGMPEFNQAGYDAHCAGG